MDQTELLDVLIIGGSYAGLAAAMTLGRSMRKVLIIDSGKPCNRQTPHSHNFITQDGETPAAIAAIAKEQVLKYPTISWLDGKAIGVVKKENHFEIETENEARYRARKLLFATGIKDHMPELEGFADCWGISVLHCPYCHGYEVKDRRLAVYGNGDAGFHLAMLIQHWSKDLSLFTGGEPVFSPEQIDKLKQHRIEVIAGKLQKIEHEKGYLNAVILEDGSRHEKDAMFARVPMSEHSGLPAALGCNFDELGYIEVDNFKKTSVNGVFAAGDNTTMMRSVSVAAAAGMMAGSVINKELIEEDF